MKAAIVQIAGTSPVYGDFKEPLPSEGTHIIIVTAAALSPVTKSRASGSHYSAGEAYPFVAGLDGVGRLATGERVYFILPDSPFGSMAEKSLVPQGQCLALPSKLEDDVAAAIAIPGVSSWAAYKLRAGLLPGETVLVNGATGASGKLAVQIAKHLGAKKVIATGRNVEILRSLEALGADTVIPLTGDAKSLEAAFQEQFSFGIDVVLDYLWGEPAEILLRAATTAGADAVPIRYVQIGSVAGPNITLSSACLRSSAIAMVGSGIGSIQLHHFVRAIDELLKATTEVKFQIDLKIVPLRDVEQTWNADSKQRLVYTID